MRDIFLIHTVPMIIQDISIQVKKEFPNFRVSNVLDDYILSLFDSGNENVKKRLSLLINAIKIKNSIVVITCSSLSRIAREVDNNLVLIDEYMLKKASTFKNILVVATAETTIEPTVNGIKSYNNDVNLDVCFVEHAIDFYKNGDKKTHDEYVINALKEQLSKNSYDVIVLAQASLAHLREPIIKSTNHKEVLTNVSMMIEQLKKEILYV